MKSFKSQNTSTKSNLLMMLNFLLSIAIGVLLIAFTDILKNQSLFLITIILIFSWMLIGTFIIKKQYIEMYEYSFDELKLIRKNLKTGKTSAYNLDMVKQIYISSVLDTSHLPYIELVFTDDIIWKIMTPPFSSKQLTIYKEFKEQIKSLTQPEK
ncbi:MAG: hypothetical protein CVU05_04990 [Bacteroidetes bacterium HGW-Bacteroidetes-21]|jgi:Zn-dependent protease with chaperone function|nr:MAG: hypothetical protein CVU05_04990 [Bacteroidetes bacterium HGW-Bacteroidetes-21]